MSADELMVARFFAAALIAMHRSAPRAARCHLREAGLRIERLPIGPVRARAEKLLYAALAVTP